MADLLLPILLVVLTSLFLGCFGVGMKFIAPLLWEAWWLVHSLTGMFRFSLVDGPHHARIFPLTA
jgi:L-rhamnose-H+ transport protein